jgi:hypothetical protein
LYLVNDGLSIGVPVRRPLNDGDLFLHAKEGSFALTSTGYGHALWIFIMVCKLREQVIFSSIVSISGSCTV